MTFGERALRYYRRLSSDWPVPQGIEILRAYDDEAILRLVERFFQRYFADTATRIGVFGINPGRFGAGRTGVAFTDPIRLQEELGIENDLPKRPELSSVFIYRVIRDFGGPALFFGSFFITAVCPLGFTRHGKNFNYYDDAALLRRIEPRIARNLQDQIALGLSRNLAICIGKGKNLQYFEALNRRYRFFDRICVLPHPRWIMQYRQPQLDRYAEEYLECLRQAAREI